MLAIIPTDVLHMISVFLYNILTWNSCVCFSEFLAISILSYYIDCLYFRTFCPFHQHIFELAWNKEQESKIYINKIYWGNVFYICTNVAIVSFLQHYVLLKASLEHLWVTGSFWQLDKQSRCLGNLNVLGFTINPYFAYVRASTFSFETFELA